ncbi:MAG TPA: PAS domain-containing sensor histidine kinase [candidate division Zixibacteria bacterium]|nr:PAS domain-containing sensor histidine kinase [candidate division Zixibacteria bacterium]
MPGSIDSRYLIRVYNWTISSKIRVAAAGVILSIILLAAAIFLHPALFAVITLVILLLLGFTAYRIRNTGVALEYPGVDRFFQQVPCYLTIQDKDMRIIRTNEQFRVDFGDRRGELCYKAYKGIEDICPNCPVIKTFDDGKTHHTEETVVTKDGKMARMIVYTAPVTDETGKVVGVMEMSTNITQVKDLQDQLDAGRREYMELFERVPCYISILDPEMRITRANKLFRQVFGNNIGKLCHQVYHDRDTVCDDCHVVKTFKDGKIHNIEKTVIKPDGDEARLIVYSSPILDEKGQVVSVMEMATDITEVKRLQRELIYMGKTIAFMAHRIKNILMGLEGGIFVVNTGMEDKDDAMVNQGWNMIERNVKKVSQIVKDLLYCSKEREMNFQQIDPVSIVRNVYELYQGVAKKAGVGLRLSIPDKLPVGRFDPDALHSLLSNLIINAIDACVGDVSERKDSHQIEIRAWCDKRCGYVFEIEDNGAGIPGIIGETIFDDFFSTKGREGTGLGLLVAHKVIEEHDGTITFRSSEGEGTIFKAVFPPCAEE